MAYSEGFELLKDFDIKAMEWGYEEECGHSDTAIESSRDRYNNAYNKLLLYIKRLEDDNLQIK